MKKRYILTAAVATLATTLSVATAQTMSSLMNGAALKGANTSKFSGDAIKFGTGCDGRTDYAHISGHYPGTVNAESLTECPNEEVTVTTSIARHGWWIFPEYDRVTKTAFGKVSVVVALNCKWKKGNPKIRYVVKSNHSDTHGEIANTQTVQYLDC